MPQTHAWWEGENHIPQEYVVRAEIGPDEVLLSDVVADLDVYSTERDFYKEELEERESLAAEHQMEGDEEYEFEPPEFESEPPYFELSDKLAQLPKEFGNFTLKWTPKAERWLRELPEGAFDLNGPQWPQEEGEESQNFPGSAAFIDLKIVVDDPSRRYEEADNELHSLQAMFRLFQPGFLYIKRHDLLWRIKQGEIEKDDIHDLSGLRSWWAAVHPNDFPYPTDVFGEHQTKYVLTESKLNAFIEFSAKYWQIISQAPPDLQIPLQRFSGSYQRWSLSDRLIDLMVAMEAFFSETAETSYKVALRSACFLFPPGEARREAFETIHNWYRRRNDILHGRPVRDLTTEKVDLFEDHVRRSILRVLDFSLAGKALKPRDFDNLALLPWNASPEAQP